MESSPEFETNQKGPHSKVGVEKGLLDDPEQDGGRILPLGEKSSRG